MTVVVLAACHFCTDAEEALELLGHEFRFRLTRIDAVDPLGQELLQRHRAAMSPLVLLNGRFVSSGRLPRGKLRKLLAATAGAPSVSSAATS